MTMSLVRRSLWLTAALAAVTTTVTAQSIADRVKQVRDGRVRMSFALRPGVCGYGSNISTYRSDRDRSSITRGNSRTTRDVEYDFECDSGPGRLVLDVEDGAVRDLRFYVGGRWRASSDATDLGTVGAKAASDYLLSLAQTNDGKAGRSAIFPSTLADSTVVWPTLIRIARDEDRPNSTRKDAVFWLSQAAEEAATQGLDDLVNEGSMDREVREQAIFALSQRPKDEGVPALIKVVRTNRDPELRKKALFWLGQSGDKRALDLIEELLTRR